MTFAANEISQQGGAPIELYTITHGSSVFRYTTAEDTITSGGSTFDPIEIERSVISLGPENRTQNIDVQVKANNDFAARFIGVQPSNKATMVVQRIHRFDTPTPEVVQIFEGQVRSIRFVSNGFKAIIAVMPLTGALSRTIPLYTSQSPCNNVLFDARCQVVRASFTFAGTVTVVSSDGLTLTVPGLDASKGVGFATAGQIEVPATSDPRLVILHSATDQLKLHIPFRNSVLGTSVNVLAGCDHSIAICKTKFNNVINYQANAFVPTRNPFESGLN